MLKLRSGLIFFYIIALASIAQCQDADSVVDSSLVIVDRLARSVEFNLSWTDKRFGKNDFWLSLRSPSGVFINEETSDPQVSVISTGNALAKGYRITQPDPGVWEVIIEHPLGAEYFSGRLIKSDLIMDWNFVNPTPRIYEPIIIEAKIFEPEPVVAATVTAVLKKYGLGPTEYTEFNLVLLDDGWDDDKVAADGVYTATFRDTGTEGSYCVEVAAQGFAEKAGQFERSFSKCTVVSDRNPLTEMISEEELAKRRTF